MASIDTHLHPSRTYVIVSANVVVTVSGPKIVPIWVVTDMVVVVTNI
jgi:hypothetical protein